MGREARVVKVRSVWGKGAEKRVRKDSLYCSADDLRERVALMERVEALGLVLPTIEIPDMGGNGGG